MSTAAAELVESLFHHDGQSARCYRIMRVPRLPRDRMLTALTSPLIGAYQLGAKVFAAWSHRADGPFTVHVGGTHGFPSWVEAGGAAGGLLFPPGAEAFQCGEAAAALGDQIAAMPHWVRIGAVVEAAAGAGPVPPAEPEALEDHASFLADRAFELLTIAVPVATAEVAEQRTRLAAAIFHQEQQLARGEAGLALAQLRARLHEHAAATAAGLWRVHGFAGSADRTLTRQLAALWCAATSPHGPVRHRLAPVGEVASLRAVAAAVHPPAGEAGQPAGELLSGPFTVGSAALATLCRPPLIELPGVAARATNPFDLAADVQTDPPATAGPAGSGAPGSGGSGLPGPAGSVGPGSGGSGGSGSGPAGSAGPAAAVPLGEILDPALRPVGTLSVPLRSIGMHTFIAGATGAGKSQATRHLLTELSRRGIPWVVLEPAKSEYATGMRQRLAAISDQLPDPALAQVHLIRPGDPGATPVCLPPLRPEPGFPYQSHLDVLIDLMVAAFDAESPFPEVLTQAVEMAVRESGWDAGLAGPLREVSDLYPDGGGPAYPDLADLIRCCHQVIDSKGYGREVAGNVHGFVDMRLGTLTTGSKRAAFSTGYPLSMPALLRRNVVLELQDLGTDSDRALFMGLFLARLSQAVRLRHRADPRPDTVRNLVCVEEAHRLLADPQRLSPAAARAVGSFTDLLAEVRSQGVALIVAEQIPAKLAPDVVKNTAVTCLGRTPAADDRALVGAAIGLDEAQSRELVALPAGQFAVHADGYDRPVLVRFPYLPESGAATPADPAPLVDQLPGWYGPAAAPGGLTQRDLAWAVEAAGDPRLIALCELTVVAQLAHHPLPVPDSGLRERLLAPYRCAALEPGTRARDTSRTPSDPEPGHATPRVRPQTRDEGELAPGRWPGAADPVGAASAGAPAVDAAIGMLTAAAVKARRSVLGRYPAEDLITVAAAAVRAAIAGATAGPPDPRWRSRPHQWLHIRDTLGGCADDAPAHPETARWRGWGVTYVEGDTIRAQRINLLSAVLHRRDDLAVAYWGRHRPGGLERAALASGLPLPGGLEQLLRGFDNPRALAGLRSALLRHADPVGSRRHGRPVTSATPAGVRPAAGPGKGDGNGD